MLAEAPLESPAESVGAAVLDDHDLLGVVLGWALRAASDDALPWCCPPIDSSRPQRSASAQPPLSLVRALRLRRVCSRWCGVVEEALRAARGLDVSGCRYALLPTQRLGASRLIDLSSVTELLVDGVSEHTSVGLAGCPSLSALSLRSAALTDALLAGTLGTLCRDSVHGGLRLRSLSLANSRAGSLTFEALTAGPPRALTSLDLSGCRLTALASPMRFERLLLACPRLVRLDLSFQTALDVTTVGAICGALAPTLAQLRLDGCGMDDERLGLDDAPSALLNMADRHRPRATAAADEPPLRPPARLWPRLRQLRELGLSDNPRVSGRAIGALVGALPALTSLDLGGSDMMGYESAALIAALTAAPRLRWLGLRDCGPWIEAATARALQAHGLRLATSAEIWTSDTDIWTGRTIATAGGGHAGGSEAGCQATRVVPPLDSWEDVETAVEATAAAAGGEVAGLPAALSLPAGGGCERAFGGRLPSAVRRDWADGQRSHALHALHGSSSALGLGFSSIYHVSYGDRPLYGGGSAARSQTDAHGLRS